MNSYSNPGVLLFLLRTIVCLLVLNLVLEYFMYSLQQLIYIEYVCSFSVNLEIGMG